MVVPLAVHLHEDLVEVQSPRARLHAIDTALPDLGREQRPEAMPTELDRLVADLGAALGKQVLDVPERKREADEHHHR